MAAAGRPRWLDDPPYSRVASPQVATRGQADPTSVNAPSARRRSARSPRRRVLFWSLLALLQLVALETAVRAAVACKVGPGALVYGTPLARKTLQPKRLADRPWHEQVSEIDRSQQRVEHDDDSGYLKYHPHQQKDGYDEHGVRYAVGINAHGFRGREFSPEKPPGTLRIATLGASSTFGYHDRDDETYPWYLEQRLNERLAREPLPGVAGFEVMNFGIPHLDSGNVLSLLRAEALAFAPDVVTLYEGINDTRQLAPSAAERLLHALSKRLVLAQFAYQAAMPLFASFGAPEFVAARAGKRERFLANVAAMRELCRERGIRFVVVTQQAQSETLARAALDGTTYAEEAAQVRARLDAGARVSLRELQFLLHAELMAALEEWAAREQVERVDGIGAIERAGERDALLSWVHLAPAGNRALAAAMAERVWDGFARR